MSQSQAEILESADLSDEVAVQPQGSRWAKSHHVLLYLLAATIALWLLTGFYAVKADEVAIVERLGDFISGTQTEVDPLTQVSHEVQRAVLIEPGQHFGLPWPLDVVHKIPTKKPLAVNVDDFDQINPMYEEYKRELLRQGYSKTALDARLDPYLITADKNVLKGKMTVHYRINNPQDYLMSVSHELNLSDKEVMQEREVAIRQIAIHALIREMAKTKVDWALQDGKQDLMTRLTRAMNPEAAKMHLGIQVENVTLEVRWPAQVDDAFKSVTAASFGRSSAILDANSYKERLMKNTEVGEVSSIQAEANSYKQKVVEDARGEMKRFEEVYKEYKSAPEITRINLYADAIISIMQNVARVMLVQPGQKGILTIEPPEEKVFKTQQPPR